MPCEIASRATSDLCPKFKGLRLAVAVAQVWYGLNLVRFPSLACIPAPLSRFGVACSGSRLESLVCN